MTPTFILAVQPALEHRSIEWLKRAELSSSTYLNGQNDLLLFSPLVIGAVIKKLVSLRALVFDMTRYMHPTSSII